MQSKKLLVVLSLAICPTLAAQQAGPPRADVVPPTRERAIMVEGQDMMRAREMAVVDERRRAMGDPLERYLFPPDLIMRRQREIGLQPAQRQQITQAIGRLEASLVELQWSMQDQQQALAEMLQQPQVNADAALQALDRVLATEVAVKRVHFQALLQIRNILTPEQQERLRPRMVQGELMRDDER